jgi:glycerol-3-phosphate dehydrogenase
VGPDPYEALASRYGHAAHDVLALASERGELAQPIVAGLPDLLAEAALAARREQARSIGDVLLRRTRLGLLAARELTGAVGEQNGPARGSSEHPAPVRRVGEVLARELQWSAERLELELDRFAEEAAAEGIAASPELVDDVPAAGSPEPSTMP